MAEEQSGRKIYEIVQAEPKGIVIHCSDPRFQKPFGEFVRGELDLPDGSYIPFAISGGVASLSEPLKLPSEFKFMKDRIALFLGLFRSITRIVLINHEDCRHYDAMKDIIGQPFLGHASSMKERQQRDLLEVARTLLGMFRPDLELEMYYARFVNPDHKQIVFDEIG